ncbi:MAG: MgtC/SapB family protein [Planctomycetes bacterium]|nr:MgtC/SapB family protein [Planctomycetota bacterium]
MSALLEATAPLEPVELVLGFALALAVGGAVGLERERHAFAEQKPSFGGARTFPLVALLGALLALLARAHGPMLLVAGFVALTALLGLGYWGSRRVAGDVQLGLTTEFSALVVFLIGALPFVETASMTFPLRLLLGGALGTVVMSLLALRRPIHEFAERISYEDLLAVVRFALVAVVALPLLPDRSFGAYDALNPFRIGVVVVLIAGISFVGYVAVRLLGARRGIGMTGLAGGLVSSTAVTLTFSAKGKEHPELARACALAISLAATIMFARVLVEVLAIRPELVLPTSAPLGAMLAVGVLGSLVLWRRANGPQDDAEPAVRNPFRLRQAVRLGLLYAAVRLLAAAAWNHLGERGLLASAAIAGLADVDAITVSVARMHAESLPTDLAVSAVTLAAVTNTVVKVVLAVALGGRRVALAVLSVLLPAAAVGAAVAFFA